MYIRYLGFLLLIWFPDLLHAQSAKQSCRTPRLDNGYFETVEIYPDGQSLIYACDKGHKPAVEGWWATSICENGNWSHTPQCIDEKACIPPNIPHAEHNQEQDWYKEGHVFRVSCQKGYEHKDRNATTTCSNGAWTLQLVCEKTSSACGEPPKIPHAVIINQEYQDLFAADSVLQYECEEGFTVEGVDTKKTIICISGNWSTVSPCRSTGSGSTVGVTNGGHTTSTKPTGRGKETRPSTGPDESTVGGRGSTGSGSTVGVTNGGHTTSTQPTGRGSSTTSGSNDRNSQPLLISIGNCGDRPVIPNGDVVETGDKYLKYKCVAYHELVGSETVVCYSDGTWSQTPVCKESFCVINPAQFAGYNIQFYGSEYMEEGERKYYNCGWQYFSSLFECTNQRLSVTRCCQRYDHNRGQCKKSPLPSG
ncbi:complement factor H-like isoform X2 [Scomber japonicus]|uniref:complement factor H-like isoform X2 n=1 Tax=Scomber japonicus TaxID=13676 RepID=UPI0023069E82|nr:complement factor H-like isoform X2 [Scomber japonicus]